MSMSVGGIGGYGGIDLYERYRDMSAGRISAEDAVEMADAVDFGADLNNMDQLQDMSAVLPVEQTKDQYARIEPAEESAQSTADHLNGNLSHVMEDMMDIQGSMWGFSMRRVMPLELQL